MELPPLSGRGERMKQAKADAQELIDGYHAEKQEEFNNKVLAAGTYSQLSFLTTLPTSINLSGGSGGSASAKLQGETNNEVQIMQAQFQRNAQKAIDVLLSKCCEVSLDVPTARVRATQKGAMLQQQIT